MKLQSKPTNILDRVIDLLAIFGGILIALVVSVTIAIILRGLKVGVIWMFEITEYSLLWLTFLGATWVLKQEAHIKMDLVLGLFNPRTQTALNIVNSIIGAMICLILAGFGIKVTWDYFRTGYFLHTAMAPPLYPILVVVPVGFLLLFIQFLRRTRKYVGQWRKAADAVPSTHEKTSI